MTQIMRKAENGALRQEKTRSGERVFRGGYEKGIGKGFRLKIGGRWRECRHSRQRMKKLQQQDNLFLLSCFILYPEIVFNPCPENQAFVNSRREEFPLAPAAESPGHFPPTSVH